MANKRTPEQAERARLEALVWKHTHRGFKSRTPDGARTVLHLVPGSGTCIVALAKLSDDELLGKLPSAMRVEIDLAKQLTARQRATLAWLIESWPYPYRGSPLPDVASLVALSLVEPPTADTWEAATALGRRVWERAKDTWKREWDIGAAWARERGSPQGDKST